MRIVIWACENCGLWVGAVKPSQCAACGLLNFVRFDSKAEAQRWAELELWQKAGVISELRRQVRYPLHAARMDEKSPSVVAQKVSEYIADFTYQKDGEIVVEDAKGNAITDVASLKLRWFHAQYGFAVRLTKEA